MTETRTSSPQIGLVIPCYNEEQVIPCLLAELDRFIKASPHPVFVLFVDDGSRDRTFEMLKGACAADPHKACLRFSRNFGHQTAVSAGLRVIVGDVVAVLDADLQDPLDVVPRMMEKWREGFDVIYGVRQNRKESWLLRSAYASFYRLLTSIANIDLPLDAGDFSLMDRRVVDQINAMPEHNRFVRGLRSWVGFRQLGLPYDRQARAAGKPKYNLKRLIELAINGLISFSTAPLRLSILLGLGAAALGFVYLAYAIVVKILNPTAPIGWASIIAMIIFFGGMQLLVLGIIGEYLGRIFEETKQRPLYVVEEVQGWLKDRLDP